MLPSEIAACGGTFRVSLPSYVNVFLAQIDCSSYADGQELQTAAVQQGFFPDPSLEVDLLRD